MHVQEDRLKEFVTAVLTRVGVTEDKARNAAEVLVFADSRGIESHGVSKLPIYVQRIKAGGINPAADPKIVSRTGGICRIDGENAMGPVAGHFGAETAVQNALENGIGLAAVGNSNHFGVTAFYSMKGLDRGIIGFAMSNANPTMAPWGGKKAMVGTSPLSIAVPTGNGLPLVVDMASSLVARGKILLAAQAGRELPQGWALDKEGRETRNPEAALQGLLSPMGGPKGSGLALIIDILCGVLSGSKWLTDVGHLYSGLDTPQRIGHVFGGIKIEAFMKVEEFYTIMNEYVHAVHDCPRAEGFDRIYMPGEIEYLKTLEAKAEGIKLSDAIRKDLETTAEELDLSLAAYA